MHQYLTFWNRTNNLLRWKWINKIHVQFLSKYIMQVSFLSIIDVIALDASKCMPIFAGAWMKFDSYIKTQISSYTGRLKIMNAVFYWSSLRFFPERVTAFVRNIAVSITCVMRITIFCLHSHAPHDMILILKRSKNIWYHS